MNKLKITFVFTVLLFFLINTSEQSQISSNEVDKLEENAITKFHVVGVSVRIVKDGKIIHSKGYGLKSIDTKEKVNEHTNIAFASNSKAFTAATLAIQLDTQKIISVIL